MERLVLRVLDFRLTGVTPLHFLDPVWTSFPDHQAHSHSVLPVAKYLLLLSLQVADLIGICPSTVCRACVTMARLSSSLECQASGIVPPSVEIVTFTFQFLPPPSPPCNNAFSFFFFLWHARYSLLLSVALTLPSLADMWRHSLWKKNSACCLEILPSLCKSARPLFWISTRTCTSFEGWDHTLRTRRHP